MRQLLIILSLFFSCANVYSFQDPITASATNSLITKFQAEGSTIQRLQLLEQYKNFLFKRLNTISFPNLKDTEDSDPQLEEYRSLTEFDGYINLIEMDEITEKNCQNTITHIENAGRTENELAPEATKALGVLTALCQQPINR